MIQHQADFKILDEALTYEQMLRQVEKGFRICYASEPPNPSNDLSAYIPATEAFIPATEAFISAKLKTGHETPIEHISITVEFSGDRGFTHELVRHRLAAFSQQSTRYCNFSKDKFGNQINVIRPFGLDPMQEPIPINMPKVIGESTFFTNDTTTGWAVRSDPIVQPRETKMNVFDVWLVAMLWAEWAYMTMLAMGTPPEWARSVLPQSTKAPIIITANLREWRHIFKLRALGLHGCPHPQMQELMIPLLKEMATKYPAFFQDLANQIKVNERSTPRQV